MENIRVWFYKKDLAKYMSHLDLNRCMSRAIRRAQLPIWYTEGFNPRPFMTFAVPLSLGIEGERESFDMRLISELDKVEIINKLNQCLPKGVRVFDVTDQVMKQKDICYASFEVRFFSESLSLEKLELMIKNFLCEESIQIEKKTKSGRRIIDIKREIKKAKMKREDQFVKLSLILPAGNVNNVNPFLFERALKSYTSNEFFCDIIRTGMYNKNFEVFV